MMAHFSLSDDKSVVVNIVDPNTTGSSNDLIQSNNNLYDILGAGPAQGCEALNEAPPMRTVDPFRNHTESIEGVYEWVKIVVCLPIVLIRLILLGFFLIVGYTAAFFALQGWNNKDEQPIPQWRRRIMWVTRFCARGILFSFGYHWIKRTGKAAPRKVAPIAVSNHISYIEPIFFIYELFPSIVASESHNSIPIVGTIIKAMQVINVNRLSKPSRKHAVNEIKRKASSDEYPRVLLFPEGTTTNGRAVISFQNGAFIPGYPIQPVVVRYPHVHFDQSWGNIDMLKLVFRMLTQFHNFMEVEYLPVISPESKKETPPQFAQRTSAVIATCLNVVQTSHSYGDAMLLTKASQYKQENPSLYMVEMGRVKSVFDLSSLEAVDFLDIYLSMSPDSSGYVEIDGFLKVTRLKHCSLSEKIFGFIDRDKIGKITFRQFLLGSAYVLKQPLFEHCCELAFTTSNFNNNNKNFISEQEFGDSVKLAIPNLNEDEISRLFTLFDADSDGKMSKDDFVSSLRKNPLLIALFFPLVIQEMV